MVEFNPKVQQTNDPNYMGMSKSISQPYANKSFEALFKGAGNLFDLGTTAVDYEIKRGIKDELQPQLETLRKDHINTLEQTRNTLDPSYKLSQAANLPIMAQDDSSDATGTAPVPKAGQPLDILGDKQGPVENMPSSLKNLPRVLETLQQARANGKLSEDKYTADADTIVAKYKNNYPGYADYVEKIQQSTLGFDSNKRVATLLGDINSMITTKDADKEKISSMLRAAVTKGYQKAAEVSEAWENGLISRYDAMKFVNDRASISADHELNNIRRAESEGEDKDQATMARKGLTATASRLAANAFDGAQKEAGLQTPQKMVDFVVGFNNGTLKFDPTQIRAMGESLAASRHQVFQEIIKMSQQPPKDPQTGQIIGKSQWELLGGKEVERLANEQLVLWDQALNGLIYHKEFGSANVAANYNRAAVDGEKSKLLSHGGVGEFAKKMSAVTDLMGPQFSAQYWEQILKSSTGIDEKFREYVTESKVDLTAQPDVRENGFVPRVSATEKIVDAKRKGVTDTKVFEELANYSEKIVDPRMPAKARVALAAAYFEPGKNQDLIKQFAKDGTDAQGRKLKGQYFFFNRFASQDMAQSIAQLDKTPEGKGILGQYTNWVENTFANQLFGREIADLRELNTKDMRVAWDPKNKIISVMSPDPAVQSRYTALKAAVGGDIDKLRLTRLDPRMEILAKADQSIQFLNDGIKGLKTVYTETGQSVDNKILQVLTTKDVDLQRVEGLPKDIADAILLPKVKAHLKQRESDVKSGRKVD